MHAKMKTYRLERILNQKRKNNKCTRKNVKNYAIPVATLP